MEIKNRLSRTGVWAGGALILALLVIFLLSYLIEGPLRQRMEKQINMSLEGYSVELLELDFHPFGFAVTLYDLIVRQDVYPDPPVAHFPRLDAHVHWRALLSGRLVAEFDLQNPRVHVNLEQLRREAENKTPVEERGWQGAVRAIYPLKINRLTISEGDLVYIDEDPERPLHVDKIDLQAENIRNVESPDRTYPSPFTFSGRVFETGRASMQGKADFLAEPHFGMEAEIELAGIALEYFKPVLSRHNLYIDEGIFSASGQIEYAPEVKIAHLRNLQAHNLALDYIHSAETEKQEKEKAEKVQAAAQEAGNKPGLLLRIDHLSLTGRLGLVNNKSEHSYRIFVNPLDFQLTNLSNQFRQGEARARLQGRFMGSGEILATATFRPEIDGPNFDLNIKIEETELTSMNKLLQTYGNFDVVGGQFSLYSEISVKNDSIDGYIKPLFQDMEVYDRRQDEEKNIFSQMYEGLVEGISDLLENVPREEVATRADISGEIVDPETNTWQVIINLIQNAFFKAILPGFEQEVSSSEEN